MCFHYLKSILNDDSFKEYIKPRILINLKYGGEGGGGGFEKCEDIMVVRWSVKYFLVRIPWYSGKILARGENK